MHKNHEYILYKTAAVAERLQALIVISRETIDSEDVANLKALCIDIVDELGDLVDAAEARYRIVRDKRGWKCVE